MRVNSPIDRVKSLLVSMEEAYVELELQENLQIGAHACVPLETHVEMVLEKLPRSFQQKVKQHMKFLPKISSKKVFAQLLIQEAEGFNWPKK